MLSLENLCALKYYVLTLYSHNLQIDLLDREQSYLRVFSNVYNMQPASFDITVNRTAKVSIALR